MSCKSVSSDSLSTINGPTYVQQLFVGRDTVHALLLPRVALLRDAFDTLLQLLNFDLRHISLLLGSVRRRISGLDVTLELSNLRLDVVRATADVGGG